MTWQCLIWYCMKNSCKTIFFTNNYRTEGHEKSFPCRGTYIKDTFSLLKISISPVLIQEILNLTECHPYYTQLLCQTIYYSVKGERTSITQNDIRQVYYKVILSESSYFEELWRELLEKKYCLQILKHLALNDRFPYRGIEKRRQDIYYALSSLEDKGYIEREERGSYIIKDPFFKEYIRLKEYGQI